MLGSRDEAEDAVQLVFVAAHRQLTADDRDINLKPWLYTIARNRCLSMLRARREEGRGDLEVSTEGLQDVAQRRADLRALLADLQDLPDDQRSALVLTEIGDLSHPEVAHVLDCEVAQVKGLVFRARSGLVERRDAREADCEEIRVELANATGGGLRRGRLRHHLKACSGCAGYLDDLRSQRLMLSLVLPVVPTLGLKSSVLGALGAGSAAGAGAATAITAGGAASLGAATAVKLAVAGVLVSGAGVAAVVGDRDRDALPPAGSGPQSPGADAPAVTPPLAEDGAARGRDALGRPSDRRGEGEEGLGAFDPEGPADGGRAGSGGKALGRGRWGTWGNAYGATRERLQARGRAEPRIKGGSSPPARDGDASAPEKAPLEAAPRRRSPVKLKAGERIPRRILPEETAPGPGQLPD